VKHHSSMAAAAALATVALVSAAQAAPVTYELDPAHTHVGFRIRHIVSNVSGQFDQFTGPLIYDAENPAGSSVETTIQTASIDTNNDKRDGHLKSPDFFDAEKNPTITFKSKTVAVDGKKLTLAGDLTMHGITKPVTLTGEVGGVMGQTPKRKAGFSVTGTINRKDWDITWNRTLDQDNTLLGDDVALQIDVEANEKAPATASTEATDKPAKVEATNK
jgi:polyisoprenoid-binding protein YceI